MNIFAVHGVAQRVGHDWVTEKQHEFYLKSYVGAESPKLDKGSESWGKIFKLDRREA